MLRWLQEKGCWFHCSTAIFIYLPSFCSRARSNTRSVFKQSLSDLNSEIFFSKTGCYTKDNASSLHSNLLIDGERIVGCIPCPRVFALCEMQKDLFTIWIRSLCPFPMIITITVWMFINHCSFLGTVSFPSLRSYGCFPRSTWIQWWFAMNFVYCQLQLSTVNGQFHRSQMPF